MALTKILNFLRKFFRCLHNIPNKLGYIAFFVLSYSLYLDWVQVSTEFHNSAYVDAKTCEHHYNLNKCNTPIHALVEQCIKWYTCSQTQNISGTLIWAEVIKRFINNILTLDSHAIILIAVLLFIVLLLCVDGNVSKDIIRQLSVCGTIVGIVWVVSTAYKDAVIHNTKTSQMYI